MDRDSASKKSFAETMRQNPTPAESHIQKHLEFEFGGYMVSVISQEVVGPYIVDFMIYPQRIVLEVDGGYHDEPAQQAYDKRRDKYLRNLGLRIVRVSNSRVMADPGGVCRQLKAMCGELKPKPKTAGGVRITICPPAKARGHWGTGKNQYWGRRKIDPDAGAGLIICKRPKSSLKKKPKTPAF
jgi:very-short-patch-repair endonuclease